MQPSHVQSPAAILGAISCSHPMCSLMQPSYVQSHAAILCAISCIHPMCNLMHPSHVQSHAAILCTIPCRHPMCNLMLPFYVQSQCETNRFSLVSLFLGWSLNAQARCNVYPRGQICPDHCTFCHCQPVLQVTLAILRHSRLAPGQPVLDLTLWTSTDWSGEETGSYQDPFPQTHTRARAHTPSSSKWHIQKPEKSRPNGDSNSRSITSDSLAGRAEALTTRPRYPKHPCVCVRARVLYVYMRVTKAPLANFQQTKRASVKKQSWTHSADFSTVW